MLRALARTGTTLAPAPVAPHRLANIYTAVTAVRSSTATGTRSHGRYLTSSRIANERASSSIGSGQGGRADKDKRLRDKEREAKEKLKAKELRTKEKERKDKEKEKKQLQRVRDKERREKEKEKRGTSPARRCFAP